MKNKAWLALASLIGVSLMAATINATAQQGANSQDPEARAARQRAYQQELVMPRPIDAGRSHWIEALTWIEVRDLIAAGTTTAIIPTGGIEQNGPYVVTGKHNIIIGAICPEIAAALGNALCAPVVKFVPEGNISPPSGAMRYPGSISVRDETFQALLEDIADSLKQHGFTNIILIGDSGGNQRGMKATAEALNERWAGSGATAHFVAEYYSPGWDDTERYSEVELGIKEGESDGYHDDIWVNAMIMAVDPAEVRYDERVSAGLATINGVELEPKEKVIEWGRKMIAYRAEYTADAIRSAIGGASP